MFIEKEPAKAAEAKKAKQVIEKAPVTEPAKKKDLQGLGFQDQSEKLSTRKAAAPLKPKAPGAPAQGDPLTQVRRLFAESDLPEKLVPTNIVDFSHDPSSGALTITLQAAFSRKFDEENTVQFDRVISGVLRKGSFSGIDGIKRGSATIVSMSRAKAGVVAIRGKMGPFGKTMEFKDESLPGLP